MPVLWSLGLVKVSDVLLLSLPLLSLFTFFLLFFKTWNSFEKNLIALLRPDSGPVDKRFTNGTWPAPRIIHPPAVFERRKTRFLRRFPLNHDHLRHSSLNVFASSIEETMIRLRASIKRQETIERFHDDDPSPRRWSISPTKSRKKNLSPLFFLQTQYPALR